MKTYLISFAIALLTSIAATEIVRRLSLRFGMVDQPHPERKIHDSAIPRVGGLAVLFAVLIPMASFYLYPQGTAIKAVQAAPGEFHGIFLAAALVCLLGLVDDLRGMNAWTKFSGQVLVAVLMYSLDFRITLLSNPFGGAVHLYWLSLPVTVIWYVAVMNAINLIDGLDGLAAGLSLIISMVLFILALVLANGVLGVTTIILAGALMGFLLFNFNPARIFLGDSGSNLIGFLIATFSIMAHVKGQAAVALFLPIVALGVPFLDVVLSILRRMAMKQPVFSGDSKHIHHILLQRGYTQRRTALYIYGMGATFAAIAILMMFSKSTWVNALLFIVLLAIVVVIIRFLGYHRMLWYSFNSRDMIEGEGSKRMRDMIQDLIEMPRDETSIESIADALHQNGVHEIILLRTQGMNSEPLFSSVSPKDPAGRENLVTSKFWVRPPEGGSYEMIFRWPAQPGQFAPMPHEEAYLRVAADLAELIPLPGGRPGTVKEKE